MNSEVIEKVFKNEFFLCSMVIQEMFLLGP